MVNGRKRSIFVEGGLPYGAITGSYPRYVDPLGRLRFARCAPLSRVQPLVIVAAVAVMLRVRLALAGRVSAYHHGDLLLFALLIVARECNFPKREIVLYSGI